MIFISVYKLLYSSFHVRSAVLCGAVWCMSRVEVLPPKAGRGKGGVAVHCAAGVSRASTSCIASLGFQMISAERSCKSFPRISMDFQATSLLIFISFCYFKLTGSCWYLHSAERERERESSKPVLCWTKMKDRLPWQFWTISLPWSHHKPWVTLGFQNRKWTPVSTLTARIHCSFHSCLFEFWEPRSW